MADILIRGRKPPKNCSLCPLNSFGRFGDSCYFGVSQKDGRKRPIDCPFIELPEHGDLIDRDAFIDLLPCGDIEHDEKIWKTAAIADAIFLADKTPVIIPSNKEGTE